MSVIDKSKGYIVMWRSIQDSAFWTNPRLIAMYTWILMRAAWEDKEVFEKRNKVKIKAGQFITSLPHASKELGMGQATVDAYLNILVSERIIDRTPTPKYTVITVLNWAELQTTDRTSESWRIADGNKEYIKYIKDIWDFYLATSKTKELLTDGRRQKLAARLKTFSPEEIKSAITNCFGSAFHTGKNDRGWKANADYLFRSDEIIDTLKNLAVYKPMDWAEAARMDGGIS